MPIGDAQPRLPPPPSRDDLHGLLTRVHPFSLASDAARNAFALTARRHRAPAGTTFWRVGEPALSFSFVRRGLIKMVRPRAGGRSDIIGIFGPGEAIGIVIAMRGMPYPAAAVAASPQTEVVHVPSAEILDTANREPAFAAALAQCCAERACRMRDMHAVLSAGGVESRLAAFLLELSDRFGDTDEDGEEVFVPVALSRRELAECTATTPESTIRTMSKWARDGLVRTHRGGFIIGSLDRLREIAEPLMIRSLVRTPV